MIREITSFDGSEPQLNFSDTLHLNDTSYSPMFLKMRQEGGLFFQKGVPVGHDTQLGGSTHPPIVIREYHLRSEGRYEESHLLSMIHTDGNIIPGTVSSIYAEEILMDGQRRVVFKNTQGKKAGTWAKQRLALADSRLGLEFAESVNDLLMMIYNLLEVHRTVSRERRVLHRDISLHNILMYPKAVQCADGSRVKKLSPLIDDVLQDGNVEEGIWTQRSLIIDYDNGALHGNPDTEDELQKRTGTPVYIARAAAVCRVVLGGAGRWVEMPTLSGDAKSLYVAVYGEERYSTYNDTETIHGGIPFSEYSEVKQKAFSEPFYHRLEYDAESIFWTTFVILLRVLPRDGVETPQTRRRLKADWDMLFRHPIPHEEDAAVGDARGAFLTRYPDRFHTVFFPVMHDVAGLIGDIAEQVGPSYPLMKVEPPHEDHLHEAMQRLILGYLVKHRDDPIPLTPGVLRAVASKDTNEGARREIDTTHWAGIVPRRSLCRTQSPSCGNSPSPS